MTHEKVSFDDGCNNVEIQKVFFDDGDGCIVRVDKDGEVVATQAFPNEWTAQNAIDLLHQTLRYGNFDGGKT